MTRFEAEAGLLDALCPPEPVPSEPAFPLYPYQRDWVEDASRLKIAVKSRRIGYSFASGYRAVKSCLEYKHNVIVLSKKEELAKEFIAEAVAPHARGIDLRLEEGYVGATSIKKQQCSFPNGSRIIALTANPDSARSYEGDVVLDEFAFHLDARKIYEAIEPSITRGYNLEIISTPNGQQGEFYELAKRAGLVDGMRMPDCEWSPHKTDIHSAIRLGCKDRNGKALDADRVRAGCLDEEMWLQEYCCQFISTASQWIPPELFAKNVSADAHDGDPSPEYRGLYAGWDVARHRDLSVIWLLEVMGDVTWTRGVIELSGQPTPDQIEEARRLMKMVQRLCIDKGSMGLTIYEILDREFYGRVEGVDFTLPTKEALAVNAKRRMEEGKCRIPDTDKIRNSFRSVKKTTSLTGQARFDAAHDQRYGHADHWWAFCLAESAASQPSYGLFEAWKAEAERANGNGARTLAEAQVQSAKDSGMPGAEKFGVRTSTMTKPVKTPQTPACPQCANVNLTRFGETVKCNACGWATKEKRP